jgi:hypothetical protein
MSTESLLAPLLLALDDSETHYLIILPQSSFVPLFIVFNADHESLRFQMETIQ